VGNPGGNPGLESVTEGPEVSDAAVPAEDVNLQALKNKPKRMMLNTRENHLTYRVCFLD
jgi:hypothetical protein